MGILVLTWLLPVGLAIVLLIIATSGKVLFLQPRTLAEAATGLLIASLPFAAVTPFTFVTKLIIVILQLVLLLLAGRLLFGRLDKAFVYPSTRSNAYVVSAMILIICAGWWLAVSFPGILGGYEWRWLVLFAAVFVMQLVFFRQLLWSFKHYHLTALSTKRSLKELPTVSVCVPARNEDHALEDCLTTALATTYPKLEVLVLDDCSQDKTSQIIRSFAHDGVRFIQGEAPADGWLGKNQAMQTLADQATGEYLLFIDVDTFLSTTSIAQLVDYALNEHAEMIAVLPQNRLKVEPGAIFDTLRDFWQVVLPLTRRRISVTDQAWLIRAKTLKELGAFKSVAHKIVPETTFARHLFSANTYRFIAGGNSLGITTAKKWRSEIDSARRILYPTYHRQPVVALAAIVYVAFAELAPLVLAAWLVTQGQYGLLLWLSIVLTLIVFVNFALVIRRTHPRVWIIATLMLPVVAIQEIVMIVMSMLNYEFGAIDWKGRNVCYPVILSEQNRLARSVSSQLRRL